MGIACDKDVARFVAHNVLFVGDNDYDENSIHNELLNAASGNTELTARGSHKLATPMELNGWRCEGYVKIGKHKRINASQWFKGDKYVYVLNESEYESIGEYDLGVVGDDKHSIEAFCKDNGFTCKIEADDVIQHYY